MSMFSHKLAHIILPPLKKGMEIWNFKHNLLVTMILCLKKNLIDGAIKGKPISFQLLGPDSPEVLLLNKRVKDPDSGLNTSFFL